MLAFALLIAFRYAVSWGGTVLGLTLGEAVRVGVRQREGGGHDIAIAAERLERFRIAGGVGPQVQAGRVEGGKRCHWRGLT